MEYSNRRPIFKGIKLLRFDWSNKRYYFQRIRINSFSIGGNMEKDEIVIKIEPSTPVVPQVVERTPIGEQSIWQRIRGELVDLIGGGLEGFLGIEFTGYQYHDNLYKTPEKKESERMVEE